MELSERRGQGRSDGKLGAKCQNGREIALEILEQAMNAMRKVGIFGGSFDPVHLAHLWIAEDAMETLGLDQLRWMPAARNPLKDIGPSATDAQRLDMLRLAISGRSGFVIDDRELRRGDRSFTVDTLREIRQEKPELDLFLIVGGDSVKTFSKWKEPAEILQLAKLAVVHRGGMSKIDYQALAEFTNASSLDAIREREIRMPTIELSSTDVRIRREQSRSIKYKVPAAVEAYIQTENLYRPNGSRSADV